MDLLQMGWTLRDIGRRLAWSDVRTILRNLPADSHYRRAADPHRAAVLPFMTPMGQLTSFIVDELRGLRHQLAGLQEAPAPLLDRIQQFSDQEHPEAEMKKKPKLSSTEIRRRVTAAMK